MKERKRAPFMKHRVFVSGNSFMTI